MKKKATPAKAAAPAPVEAAPAKTAVKSAKKPEKPKPAKTSAPPEKQTKWKRGDPTSNIVIKAKEKVGVNPRNPAMAAALAVIHELAKRALALPPADRVIVQKFLTAAYEEVKKGGGSNGGAAADPFPPPE